MDHAIRDEHGWYIFDGNRQLTFEDFYSESVKRGSITLSNRPTASTLKSFPDSPLFLNINPESVAIFKNNQKFLSEMYVLIRERLPDPLSIKLGRKFDEYAEIILGLADSIGITPNLLSETEFLHLYWLSRNMKKVLDDSLPEFEKPKLTDYFYDLDEFKMLTITLAKYFCFKFSHIYPQHEETFLKNLLWFYFINLVNNPQYNIDSNMNFFHSTKEANILFQLSQTNLSSENSFSQYLQANIEQLFLIFANNFSKMGNPHLLLDSKKLTLIPTFRNQSQWIMKFLSSNVPNFENFIEFLKHVLYVKPKGTIEDFQKIFDKFVTENGLVITTQMVTPVGKMPPLDENLVNKIKFLFKKFSANGSVVYVMDFLFMTKETGIVPSILCNREVMILFFQQVIRRSIALGKKLPEIMDADNFYYANIEDFAKILLEAAERLIAQTLPLDSEEKLKILFNRTIRM